MSNTNSCCQSVGCCLLNSFADAINNLFSTQPYCGGGNCGCGCNRSTTAFTNGFVSGVNAAYTVSGCGCNGNQNGNPIGFGAQPVAANGFGPGPGHNGCGCGCGSNADLSPYTACNNQCYDPYYAQQYGLYPFNTGSNGICSCCNN